MDMGTIRADFELVGRIIGHRVLKFDAHLVDAG
jgi:hypothetical protein